MGEITRQTKEELRQLPLMLVKLTGALLAIFGFAAWVLCLTRRTGGALTWFLAGAAGIALFLLAARSLSLRAAGSRTPSRSRSMSLVAWGLLLLFVFIFLAFSWFATR